MQGRGASITTKGCYHCFSPLFLCTGTPNPRQLRRSEVAAEGQAIALFVEHMEGILRTLPTTAAEDRALLQQQEAAREQGAPAPLSNRMAQAVVCRLEFKLLVGQGLEVLVRYAEGLQGVSQELVDG